MLPTEGNVMGRAHRSRLERGAPFSWIARSAAALGIAALLLFGRAGDAPAAVTSDGATSVMPNTNGNGERLQTSPSEPRISFTIDPIGHFKGRTGIATVSGKFTCANAPLGAFVSGDVTQTKGNRTTQGGFFFSIDAEDCDGREREWSAETILSMGRKFSGGSALVIAGAEACRLFGDIFQCVPAEPFRQEVTIRLRGGG